MVGRYQSFCVKPLSMCIKQAPFQKSLLGLSGSEKLIYCNHSQTINGFVLVSRVNQMICILLYKKRLLCSGLNCYMVSRTSLSQVLKYLWTLNDRTLANVSCMKPRREIRVSKIRCISQSLDVLMLCCCCC